MPLTATLFLIGFGLCMALALFRHPIYGLYGYVAVFYLDPHSRWWGESLHDFRWALWAAGVTLLAVILQRDTTDRPSWLSTTPAKILLLYTLWLWLQLPWALNPYMHREAAILFTKYLVAFYLIYRLIITPEDIQRFLLVHVMGCFYLGWVAFSAHVSGRLEGVGGPGIDEANALGMQMDTGIVVGSMLLLVYRGYLRWVCILAMPFLLNTVVLSGSRSAFLALLCAGIVLVRLKPLELKKIFYALAALGVVLMLMLSPRNFWQRMDTITAAVEDQTKMDTSAESRLALVRAQLKMAAAYPLGTGHRGTEALSRSYLEEKYLTQNADSQRRARSSHNTFMTAWVEQGIPGALMFIWMTVWCVREISRLKRLGEAHWPMQTQAMLAAVAAGLAVVLVAGVFVDYLKIEVQIWLYALLATLGHVAGSSLATIKRIA